MHAKPDLRVFLKWMIADSGSVITDVMRLKRIESLMAGPTACVLFPETLPNQISWRELMQDIADSWPDSSLFHIGNSTKFGGAYSGELRPFVGDVYEYQPSEYCISPAEIDATRVVLGVDISHCVELGAMCKSQCDHQLLCEIAAHLARTYNGFVDFNGVITDTDRDDLYNIKWLEDGHEYASQIGAPAACDWWLQQTNFRMVK